MACYPPPSYRDREGRAECKRACRRGVRRRCHLPWPPWHNRRVPTRHVRRYSASPLHEVRRGRTTSTRDRKWRGRYSCLQREQFRISLFRTPAPHRALKNASGSSPASAWLARQGLTPVRCLFRHDDLFRFPRWDSPGRVRNPSGIASLFQIGQVNIDQRPQLREDAGKLFAGVLIIADLDFGGFRRRRPA
jgi:hypothetical protein